MSTTFLEVDPITKKKRWNRKAKRLTGVSVPDVVNKYSLYMGGVELGTVLVSLYRIDYGRGKWTRRVFFWMANSAATNSGILYKRNCDMRKVPSRQRMDLLTFVSSDSESLLLTGKTIQSRRGLPNSSQQQEDLCGPSRKNPAQREIQENARRDQVGYWSEMQAIRPRYRVCSKSSHIYCTKCMTFSFFSESEKTYKHGILDAAQYARFDMVEQKP
ncbi:hypothetical protein T05_2059 [Trichinella murrelli]|uniref:PiggyBac transposable element-derived protein domain-containing protein n=1 Tax=Trichinella murrelli TaxID=144512 RepID=A0A0V0TXI3_9BILA|nr:hypothetical protein T05_2059 [Trichinella murrelli]